MSPLKISSNLNDNQLSPVCLSTILPRVHTNIFPFSSTDCYAHRWFNNDNEQRFFTTDNDPSLSPFSERRAGEEKAVKLAPFKFPFSKMSKSRSSDKEERDNKDKEKELEGGKTGREKQRGKEMGRESETEEEEEEENPEDEEENARGQNVRLPMSQLQLQAGGETQSNINSPILASNSVRSEQAIPSSPPPSYEHVIEQVRIWNGRDRVQSWSL